MQKWAIRVNISEGAPCNCRKSVGLQDGTLFDKSKLTRRQWIVLFYCWVRQYSVTDTVQENSAVQVHQYLRDICSWRLLNTDAPLMLGDQGVIAQIDESLFRHKPKVRSVVTFGAAPSWASHYSWVIVESVGQCYSHFT